MLNSLLLNKFTKITTFGHLKLNLDIMLETTFSLKISAT